MILRRAFLVLMGLTPLICAAESAFVAEQMRTRPPDHPTMIVAEYKGETLPIVAAYQMDPEVEYKGELRRLPTDRATFQPRRAAAFAPGSVEITDQHANARKLGIVYHFANGGEAKGDTLDEHSDYEAILHPTASYRNCYIAVMFVDKDFMSGLGNSPSSIVLFKHINDLVAGKPEKVQTTFGYIEPEKFKKLVFFTLVFSGGMEIKSSSSAYSAAFFRRVELTEHEQILTNYKTKNLGKDHPLTPYLRIQPEIPEGIDWKTFPSTVNASFMVDENGTVYSVQIETKIPHEAEVAIRRALRGWLFLPKLKQGVPTRTMANIPLHFDTKSGAN